jgi:DNA repair protein RecN (Recombination protein N)
MLQELTIRSFALIDELTLSFGSGLNIITGETGSGKSIVIDALGLVLGDRVSAQDVIRSGADKCVVEAAFSLDDAPDSVKEYLISQELVEPDFDPHEPLILSRELTLAGKNTARINGRLMPVGTLRAATSGLVDIHGQNEHQSLLAVDRHGDLLDAWLGSKALTARADVALKYQMMSGLRRELGTLRESARTREQNLDLYRHQKNEIDAAALAPNEDDGLQIERTRLANAEKLNVVAQTAYSTLSESALDGLNSALSQLERGSILDPTLEVSTGLLRDALSIADDAARALRAYRDSIEFNPGRLEEIDDRLELMRSLKRKFGATIEEILNYSVDLGIKLNVLEDSEAVENRLTKTLAQADKALAEASGLLTTIRRDGSRAFADEVVAQLHDLGMRNSVFEVMIEPAQIGENGGDNIQFIVSNNVGEPLKPLAKIASGGELSRLMLALKTVLSRAHNVPTLVFDEIDVGVGGRTAQSIGQKLLMLSKSAQVFCITHLPQIASLPADVHIAIEKQSDGTRTTVKIEALSHERRVDEIARMLGGKSGSGVVLEHAKELLSTGASA